MSVGPLFEEAAKTYQALGGTEGVTPEMGQAIQQMATGLREFGEASNLLGGLVSGTLMHVPSLYADSAPLRDASIIPLFSVSEAVVWWVVFSLLGILIGCLYLGLLARQLPIGALAGAATGSVMVGVFRHWIQVIAFVLLVFVTLLLVYIPVSVVVAVLLLISPGLGSAVAGATGILSMLLIMIFLYFVVPALIMDNLAVIGAIRRSIRLVRNNPWTTVGFLLLSMLIGLGFALLLTRLAELGAPAAVIAIVVNAYIGTGLAMAWLVFYRTQVLRET